MVPGTGKRITLCERNEAKSPACISVILRVVMGIGVLSVRFALCVNFRAFKSSNRDCLLLYLVYFADVEGSRLKPIGEIKYCNRSTPYISYNGGVK